MAHGNLFYSMHAEKNVAIIFPCISFSSLCTDYSYTVTLMELVSPTASISSDRRGNLQL